MTCTFRNPVDCERSGIPHSAILQGTISRAQQRLHQSHLLGISQSLSKPSELGEVATRVSQ